MLKIPYEDIVRMIKEQAKIPDSEINSRIQKKMEQLAGLISKEGAAHIIANELSVQLAPRTDENPDKPVRIKEIVAGLQRIETAGRVRQIFDVRNFNAKGREGKVGSFILADETGSIKVVLWNDQTDNMKNLKEGAIVKLKNAFAKENSGRKELHLNNKSSFLVNPLGVEVKEIGDRPAAARKSIKDLAENDEFVMIVGTIVQVFSPRFFEVCPNCGKRAKARGDDGFYCDEHARVTPDYAYVINAVLDDGTETIRTVFFRNQADKLLGNIEMKKYRDDTNAFEGVKNDLIGNMVKVIGRAQKNEMFDRIEFVANLVYTDVNPEEEIKRLEKEIEAMKGN